MITFKSITGGSRRRTPRASILLATVALAFAGVAPAAEIVGSARLNVERESHTATLLGKGTVLVVGGRDASGATSVAEIYDPLTRTFSVAGSSLEPRADHAAVRLADGRVLVIGGRGAGEALASTELFDPKTSTFSAGPALSHARSGHTATLLADGRVAIIGGDAAGTAEIYEPATGLFHAIEDCLNVARNRHSAVLLRDGNVLVAGGVGTDGAPLSSAEILAVDSLSFSHAPIPMLASRSGATLRVLPDGKVQAIGGDREATMEIFNPSGGYFSSLGHLGQDPAVFSAALRNTGRAAVIGSPASSRPALARLSAEGGEFGVAGGADTLDRSGFTVTEIAGSNTAVLIGGLAGGALQPRAVLFDASSATVTTDKSDYHPGETVTIIGTGWLSGETVSLNLHRDTNDPPDTVLTAVADANGNITNAEYVCQEFDAGITFLLTATGQTSGFTAQTTFTDSNISNNVSVSPASVTVTAGNSAVYTVTVQFGGNNTPCTAPLSVTSGLPAGTTATFAPPSVTGDSDPADDEQTSTLTITTTGGGTPTPAGTYLFTVTVFATGTGCTGANRTATGTLVVNAVVNAAPDAINDTGSTNEDTALTFPASGAGSLKNNDTDADHTNAELFLTSVTDPPNGTAVLNVGGSVTYTPDLNYFGSDSFSYTLCDPGADDNPATTGDNLCDTATVSLTVTSVNDAPSFVKGANQTVNEDSGPHTVVGWATAISAGPANESGQTVSFTVTGNTNPGLFSAGPAVAANGTLSYTLTANAFGSATIDLTISDNGGTANGGVDTSAAQTFTITVNAVNDAPSFVKGADQLVNEDSGLHTVVGWATSISAGPANESAQVVSFLITNNTNPGLFSAGPAVASNGTLTYSLTSNANGSATITLKAKDDGGIANGGVDESPTQTFDITVTAVNDPPSFVKGADQNVNEDTGPHSVAGWATAISAGPSDESGQTVAFTVTNDNNSLFSVQPAVAANGTLTYTLTADAFGSALVTIYAQDNGGIANGGDDTSDNQTFTITVNAVNDAPSFVKGADQLVNEDSGPHTVAGWATSISAGPANESGQVVSFLITNNTNPGLFSAGPAVASNGTLTYSLTTNANGAATITLKAKDDGGVANGGVDESATQSFLITVTAVNDEPTFVKGSNQTVAEDSGPHTVVGWATGMSAGPPDEAGQVLTFSTTNNNNALFSAQPFVAANGTLTYTPAANAFGSATVTVTLMDDGGTANGGDDQSSQTFTITVTPVNDAPANLSPSLVAATINENGAASLSGSFTDVEAGDSHTVVITWGDASPNTTINLGAGVLSIPATPHTYADDNPTGTASDSYTISVTVTDNGTTGAPAVSDPKSVSGTTSITVTNVPPSLNSFTSTDYSLAVGGSATINGGFTDVGTLDTHTCVVNWDDGAGNVAGTVASGACTATKTFTATGIYTVTMKITDDDTGGSTVMELMISVFDPNGGFVTGGGWIDSPAGAYTADPSLTGKANFGFVSKYKKGSSTNIPEGQTEFQFKAGDLNFHSSAYDAESLVVSGHKAQYKGTGTLNGVPGYRFVLTAYDGQAQGGDGTDKFRIRITNGGVVYDNRIGAPPDDIDAADPMAISGGSIVIHKGK